jgi:hypothetical protein
MITDRPVPRAADPDSYGTEPGERLRRLRRRRRLVREQIVVVVILFLALATTVAVLANQWLGSPSSSGSGIELPIQASSSLLGGST